MRTTHRGSALVFKDQPVFFWAFYSIFVAGGIAAIFISLTAAPDATTTAIGSLIGLGNIAGGLYMIRREPASIVIFDRDAGTIQVCRWYPVGKKVGVHPLSSLVAVEIETGEHSEGGPVYRPHLRLEQSESVPLSMFWYQTAIGSDEVIVEIKRFLNFSLHGSGSVDPPH